MKTKLPMIVACILCMYTSFTQTNSSSLNIKIPKTHPWLLRGNKSTDTSVNFLGTTDAMPLVFKVNNQRAGYIDAENTANTGFGYKSLYSLRYGLYNTANGAFALYSNDGYYNTATGIYALYSNLNGINNTATGSYALYSNTGDYNTAIGLGALGSNTTGSYNTAIGSNTLTTNITGVDNTVLGDNANVTESDFINATAIGSNAYVDASNKVRIGSIFVTSIGGEVGWTNFSDERIKTDIKQNVPGLSFINLLNPVTYHFSLIKENELLGKSKNVTDWKSRTDIEKINFTGLLAQQVDKAAKQVHYDFSGIDKSGRIWGLRYAEFVVPLIKSVQELSRQNDSLKIANDVQQQQIDELIKRLNKVEQVLSLKENESSGISSQTTLNNIHLGQNIPNPFKGSTTISYYLPAKYNTASINFYSLRGVLLKSVKINTVGNGNVTLKTSELPSGSCQYSLVVDGKIIDSKQMMQIK